MSPVFAAVHLLHPLAEMFPEMAEAEFAALVADVRANGLLEPIVLSSDERVLDGRHRYRACREAGVEPRFETYDGDDPLGFITSKNLTRRHLSESQRAMVAARIANLKPGDNQHTAGSAQIPNQTEVADTLRVSTRIIGKARRVIREAPELAGQVDRGEMTVGAAEAEVRRRKGPDKSRAGTVERREQIREMTAKGHRVADIAKQVGITVDSVRNITSELGLETVDNRYRARHFDADRAVDGFVLGAVVPPLAVDMLDGHYDEVDVEQIPAWIDSLTASISALSRVRNQLKKRIAE